MTSTRRIRGLSYCAEARYLLLMVLPRNPGRLSVSRLEEFAQFGQTKARVSQYSAEGAAFQFAVQWNNDGY
jgi:hypothetical protein